MARINLRDISDDVHQLISQSALLNHRSIESEARHALDQYALSLNREQDTKIETSREIWQKETGQRLHKLFQQLRDDNFFAYRVRHDIPHIAQHIGENSPAQLLDCMDGIKGPDFDMINRLAYCFSCNSSWVMSGAGTMFEVKNIGSSYESFFVDETDDHADYMFYLIRVASGRNEGMIICIKRNQASRVYEAGYISDHFVLKAGMGSGGYGNLKRFLSFMKLNCGTHFIRSCEYEEEGLSTELGLHHPSWYIQKSSQSRWLSQLLSGEDPGNWLEGYSGLLSSV